MPDTSRQLDQAIWPLQSLWQSRSGADSIAAATDMFGLKPPAPHSDFTKLRKARNEHMFSGMPLIAAGSEPAGTYVQRQEETSFSRDGLRHLDAPRPFTMI
jgi:hypothetical protein